MRAQLACLASMLLLGLSACAAQQEWRGDPQLVRQLALSMPKHELKRILGEPSDVMQMSVMGSDMQTWTYNGRMQVRLALQDGQLIGAQLDGKTIIDAKTPAR